MLGGPEVDALKALAANSQSWADWSTIVVVLGLVGEVIIAFSYTKDKPRSEIILSISCGIIIALGVFGEYRYGSRAAWANTQLRVISEGKLTDAESRLGIAEDKLRVTIREVGDAKTSAKNAKEDATRARGEADSAKERANEIDRQAEKLAQEDLTMEARLAKADQELEEEQNIRLELEKSIAPRLLGPPAVSEDRTLFENLKKFSGIQVIFETLPDAEPQRAAQEIENVLGYSAWQVAGKTLNSELYSGFFDGVTIWYELPGNMPPSSAEQNSKREAEEKCRKGAEALNAYLLSKSWKSMARPYMNRPYIKPKIPNINHEIPPNALVIVVGFKPNPFFDPEWVKQGEERYKLFMLEERDRQKSLPQAPSVPQK